MDAIPITSRAAATNRENSAVIFYRAQFDLVFRRRSFAFAEEIVERSVVNHPTSWRRVFTMSQ